MDPSIDRFDEFLRAFWQDFDNGALLPLQDYVGRFPEIEAEVRAEYADATARPADRTAGAPVAGGGARRALTIGRYRVRRRLARGGMGLLLLADDPELGRPVVLKTVRGRRSLAAVADVERLWQEARLTSRLDHESICPVLDVISDRGRLFLVMPWVEGDDLSVWLDRARGAPAAAADGPLSAWACAGDLRPVLRLVELVARAVHVAHEAGVVHRDLKPANIKVCPDGTPVVLDFGLAFDSSLDRSERLTAEGTVLGSPHYMAPEQIEGDLQRIDRRTDVYALGVILYELLTLQPPYAGGTRNQLLQRVLRGEPAPPDRLQPAVPRDVAAVCLKAMALEPRQRYDTALELADDLERVRTLRTPMARPLGTSQWLWRRVRRNPAASTAIAAAVLLGVVSIAMFLSMRRAEAQATATAALLRIIADAQGGGEPAASDVEVLTREIPDEPAREILLRQLQSDVRATVSRLLQKINDRSGSEVQETVFLEHPRADVAELRPMFRFRRPAGHLARRVAFGIESWGEPPILWETDVDDRQTVAAEPPPGLLLVPGREYRWIVTFPELAAEPRHEARFLVKAPSQREEILARHAKTEDRAWAALATAAELLAANLASDVVVELKSAPPDEHPELARVRKLLLAEAYSQLGDVESLRALAR